MIYHGININKLDQDRIVHVLIQKTT